MIREDPSASFSFKWFRVRHDRCTWKVGTDSILLGSWCDLTGASRILDIGSGSGVLSLMAAQQNKEAFIDGVEFDRNSMEQSVDNVQMSPWAQRINIQQGDITIPGLLQKKVYDHILSNPPYFDSGHGSGQTARATARQGHGFTLMEVPDVARQYLVPGGKLSVITPASRVYTFIAKANTRGLFVQRRLNVCHEKNSVSTLVMLELGTGIKRPAVKTLPLYEGNAPSQEYREMTREFLSFDTAG